jgi:hypothetical protein
MLVLMLPLSTFAQSGTKYFGYYYNDATSYNSSNTAFSENYNRINLYHIGFWSGSTSESGRAGTISYTLGQLELARQNGIKAIVTATPFVFQLNGTWQAEPNASAEWANFVNQLVSNGYIVPGNPMLSTVAAIYVFDEPDLAGLGDQNGAAHPAVTNAVNAIRSNSNTSGIPLAAIMGGSFYNNPRTIALFDWVGFDNYGENQSQWNSSYGQLKGMLAANQRTILVPKAAKGGACGVGGDATAYSDPWVMYNLIETDAKAVWLAPFRWFSPDINCPGVRDIPALSTPYFQIGQTLKQQSNPVIGNIDNVYYMDFTPTISGWACAKGMPQSIYVDLYMDGPYGQGGTGAGRYLANVSSEQAVANSCGIGSGSYRFAIPLSSAFRAQWAGHKIYMHGIAPYNADNPLLGNSGNLTVPN